MGRGTVGAILTNVWDVVRLDGLGGPKNCWRGWCVAIVEAPISDLDPIGNL